MIHPALDAFGVVGVVALVAVALALGTLSGWLYFRSLRQSVRLLVEGEGRGSALLLGLLRFVLLAGTLSLVIQAGALPFLAAAGGILVGRGIVFRSVDGEAP